MSDDVSVILASTSPYRRALLERLGVPFRVQAPSCDEEELKRTLATPGPEELVQALAEAKAASVAASAPGAVVIGSDQICLFEGEILGKPGTKRRNILQLARMQGKSHELLTAVSVRCGPRSEAHLDRTRLWMRPLGEPEIERYVERDEPWDCAGGYKLELGGIGLMERLETADPTAIPGLPLLWVGAALRRMGVSC